MSTNAGAVATDLRNTADRVKDAARKLMHRSAARIVAQAKINAPRDKWNLEESIRIERSYVGPFGRLQIRIIAGGMVNGVNVDDYAALVHEHYDYVTRVNGPGEGTREKMAEYPQATIGGKFLSRAAEQEDEKLALRMISEITSVLPKG